MPFTAIDPTTAQAAPIVTAGAPLSNVGETLASIRTELQAQVIRSDVLATRYNTWINQAYRHLSSMVTLNELSASLTIATTSGQPFYLLPPQVAWIKQIPLSDPSLFPQIGGRNMTMIDLNAYRELPDGTAYPWTYGPYKYFRYNRVLVLWPTPSATESVIVDYRIRPDPLVNDTDSPILPQEWHEAILLRARYIAFRSLQMFDKTSPAQNDFVSFIREISNTDAEEIGGKPSSFYPARALRGLYRRGSAFTRLRDYDL